MVGKGEETCSRNGTTSTNGNCAGCKCANLATAEKNGSWKSVTSAADPLTANVNGSLNDGSEEWFVSQPNRERHEGFLRKVFDMLLEDVVFDGTSRKSGKVIEWEDPMELMKILDLSLNDEPESHAYIFDAIKRVARYSVKTGNPRFVNQLFSGLDPYGLAGQIAASALNMSAYTFEVAPVIILQEQVILSEMRKLAGFPEDGDGLFCPGGSFANGYAMNLARFKTYPDVKKFGLHGGPKLVAFTSEDSHYSIVKMACLIGIGSENVIKVKVDSIGRMNPIELEKEVKKSLERGEKPFYVCATEGTTVLGAFDPLLQIHDICRRYQIWLHVDAAWGGGSLLSPKYRSKLKGIENADSITWNPHKLLAAPQQCSVLLVRDPNILNAAHSANASYLFQPDKFYDPSYDTGDKHLQCGRRGDVLKFWIMWKAKGNLGLQKHVERAYENAEYFTDLLKKREGFKLILENPEFTNICFWYIPPSLRGKENEPDFNEKLHKVAPKIKERMIMCGSMMVGYQPLRGMPNFFRWVVQNSAVNKEDLHFFADEIDRLGCDL